MNIARLIDELFKCPDESWMYFLTHQPTETLYSAGSQLKNIGDKMLLLAEHRTNVSPLTAINAAESLLRMDSRP